MTVFQVAVPRIEDEIERAWQELCARGEAGNEDADHRALFEAGFRAARTFTQVTLT